MFLPSAHRVELVVHCDGDRYAEEFVSETKPAEGLAGKSNGYQS